MRKIDISIGDKDYTVEVAEEQEDKYKGLSERTSLKKDEGMLFVYDHPQTLEFTMEDTNIDLDIIFIDENGHVTSVYPCKAHSEEPVEDDGVQFVLEVNINSGIKEGDILDTIDELDDEEKSGVNDKMYVLDPNGDVQYQLEGGERIVSRRETKQLIRLAYKAYKSDADVDYIAVGRKIFKILDGQDSRDPEYVQLEDKE